jgi:putative ABC transport system ATP-binding protein
MANEPPLVQAYGLGRRRPGGADWLLRGVCLELRPGDRLAVVGPTGSGKTLLLRALALLDPVDEGVIRWRGGDIPARAVPAYRREVTYLHQRPPLFEGSVESNLLRPFSLQVNRGRTFDRGRVLSLLDVLGRPPSFLGRPGRDLSGGEGQLVALVRALQLDPTVLLLDEPTASLDDRTARTVEAFVGQWLDEAPARRAFVWVTHDRERARRVANRTLSVQAGYAGWKG